MNLSLQAYLGNRAASETLEHASSLSDQDDASRRGLRSGAHAAQHGEAEEEGPPAGWPNRDVANAVGQGEALAYFGRQRAQHADLLEALTVEYDASHAATFDHTAHAGCRGEAWCLSAVEAIDLYGLALLAPPRDEPHAIVGSEERWTAMQAEGYAAERTVTARLNEIAKEDVCYATPRKKELHEPSWQVADAAMRHYHRLDSTIGLSGLLSELQHSHAIFSVADQVLNCTAKVLDVGIVNGLPGADFGQWHQDFRDDHPILRNKLSTSSFPFRVNHDELGPTEFSIRDHWPSCELPKGQHGNGPAGALGGDFGAIFRILDWADSLAEWWRCRGTVRDKVRRPVPAQFAARLDRRGKRGGHVTVRPDVSGPGARILIYDYLAWHRGTPNFSLNASRPTLYILLGRPDFTDEANFMKGEDGVGWGLFGDKAQAFLRDKWEVDS
ncbi:hypothetical protein FOA52_007924 [Chlamydomonas sp. UWO 241]|nr:hypothetical protein FOA52_007924 [Chlamydomonas sp. UWO 241]